MQHLFKPIPGQLLYHCASVEATEAILKYQTFRLSEFSMMNE